MRTLYHLALTAKSRKVRVVLAEKRLEVHLKAEPVWDRREEFLALNPAGEVPVLIEDDGRQPMRPGDIAVWPKGNTNGHHLINESDADCVFVALGGGKARDTGGGYSDIDMIFTPDGYFHKDGTPYPTKRIP